MEPLASKIRPKSLEEFYGQEHLVGEGKPLRVGIEEKHLFSFILWGLPGVVVTSISTAIFAGLILALINLFIKPILIILTLPINILTLGILTFFINGFLILLTSAVVPGLAVNNIWWAILMSIIVSIVSATFVKDKRK